MSTLEIHDYLQNLHGIEVLSTLISNVTNNLLPREYIKLLTAPFGFGFYTKGFTDSENTSYTM